MESVDEAAVPCLERSAGRAAVLAIGTATPPVAVEQSTFPDYYFKITNSEQMVELKQKFSRTCENSKIEKRYMCLTEEMLKSNPNVASYHSPSLDVRQELMDIQVPKLAMEASLKALKEWGRPKSDITHLIFGNTGGASMPGADYDLVKLLGLPLTIKRFMLYQIGCYGGGTVLRLAKDVAENNPGARVLAVCSEITSTCFRGPSENHNKKLVNEALFGDGAAAVIVGADTIANVERPIFEIVWTSQTILAGSEGAIVGKVREPGFILTLEPEIPDHLSQNIEKVVAVALEKTGIRDWNEVFWVMHPGARVILDGVEKKLKLGPEKLEASREVLREYGNMWSSTVLFVMDVIRRRSVERGMGTAGEGLEWGLLFGCGPGFTIETVVLRCP